MDNLANIQKTQIAKAWFPGGVALPSDGLQAYNSAIKEIFQDEKVAANFTHQEMVREIDEILLHCYALPESKRKGALFQQLHDWERRIKRELEQDNVQEWQFLVPIENMVLKGKQSLSLGKVRFCPFSTYRKRQWIKSLKDILIKNPHYSNAEKDNIIKADSSLLSHMEGKTCAEIYVKGRFERSREEALRQVRLTLGVLKLYWTPSDDREKRYFGLYDEVSPKKTVGKTSYILAKTPTQISYHSFEFPTLFNFEIDKNKIYWMQKEGLNKFDIILKKDYPTDVEARLLVAVYWFAKAVDIPPFKVDEEKIYLIQRRKRKTLEPLEFFNIGDRFLKLMVALEALLVLDNNEPLRTNISERGAMITGRNYTRRKEVKKELQKFYDIRSAIVHHGEAIITNSQVIELMYLTRKIIITLAINLNRWGISNDDSFRQWFEQVKLS